MNELEKLLTDLPAMTPATRQLAEEEIKQIAAEALGWLPLEPLAYLHLGRTAAGNPALPAAEESYEVNVVGLASGDMASLHVLWLP